MDAVPKQHDGSPTTRLLAIETMVMAVGITLVVVLVPVQLQLLKKEEEDQAAQQRGEEPAG